MGIRLRCHILSDASGIVDVVNFSDTEDRNATLFKHIEQHRLWRVHGVVMSARSSDEASCCTGEWTRDHPANAIVSVKKLSGDLHIR